MPCAKVIRLKVEKKDVGCKEPPPLVNSDATCIRSQMSAQMVCHLM